MTKQKVLIAGLAAAVLCAVCLGVVLGSKNAALKAQVDALAGEKEAVQAKVDTLTKENAELTEQVTEVNEQNQSLKKSVELIESMRVDANYSAAMAEKELEKLEEEMSDDYWESVHREVVLLQQKRELLTFFMEAELELAEQRQTSFSDETVKEALSGYYALAKGYHATPYLILSVLELREERTVWELVSLSEDIKDYDTPYIGSCYYKTDVTEKEYRDALLRRVSERLMESMFFRYTEVRDGCVYILEGGGSGFGCEVLEIERVNGSRYKGTVEIWGFTGDGKQYEVEFGVEEQNGVCVISAVKDGLLGRYFY